MAASPDIGPNSPLAGLGYQLGFAIGGALMGAAAWLLLAVPQHLINVVFATLVGIGAGLGVGKMSKVSRSTAGVVSAVVVTSVVVLVTQAIVDHAYLTWATDNLAGAPSNPRWDGPIGAVRLALDRAAGRHGWADNASYLWWSVSLLAAGVLAWATARPSPDTN